MRNRLPYLLFLIGILGMATYPRIVAHVGPAYLRGDFMTGFVSGLCVVLELTGAVMMARRGRGSACNRTPIS
jgi:hypothetical protein